MIDTHCHIEIEDYKNIEQILENCKKNGIDKIIVSGYDLESSKEAVKLADKYDAIYATVGFLPEVLQKENSYDLNDLEILLQNKKVVGIGEIGLDYYWYKDNKEEQKKLFISQIKLALKYNKPIVIHCREAIQDCYDVVKKYSNLKGTMHCYSGSVEMAKEFVKLGLYISVGGVSTFKNSKNIKEVINELDLEYILLETDSPYLTPEPYRGKRNYPYYVGIIAEKISKIKNIDLKTIEIITTSNACKLFDF
ncbi:MAG: TatD family deoxyribonuclease [Firmicutes bacterium]|nr:TatD family deoxyribonuclease [Bacillota bacterium]